MIIVSSTQFRGKSGGWVRAFPCFWGAYCTGWDFVADLVKAFLPAVGSITILVAGEMLFVPTSNSAIARMSRPEDIGKNMGILSLCATLGTSCGPLLGGFLLDRFPG